MIAEYVVTVALVVAAVMTMNFFVKRALQGRMRDARNFMIKTANDAYVSTGNQTPASISYEYEPYYAKQDTDVSRASDDQFTLSVGGASGVSHTAYNDIVTTGGASKTLSPLNAY